jgi:transcriptional regulator with XRE-family HTH domain
MNESDLKGKPGSQIRRLREERGLRPVDIQRISETVKIRKECADFGISHGTLSDIENENSVPNVRKMFSLAVCFQVPLEHILALYDASPSDIKQHYESLPEGTHIEAMEPSFAIHFDTPFDLRRTAPVVAAGAQVPDLPPALRARLDSSRYSYAWVGTEEDEMAEMIPGGSLIEIDRSQSSIEMADWSSLRERPIYFCWTKDGYHCSWCEEAEYDLVLLPHPASGAKAKRYRKPREVTLIGRVVHAWVPFGSKCAVGNSI